MGIDLSLFALTGKVAVVTGAGRGMGREIAIAYGKAGADVVVAARTAAEVEETAKLVRDTGRKSIAVPTDVSDYAQVTNLLKRTLDTFKHVDILYNNAGGNILAPVLDTTPERWDAILKENLTSVYNCCRQFGEVMVKQKSGNIINTTSMAGLGPMLWCAPYGAAKAGIINFTQTMAMEWAQFNIRVNAVAPGIIITALSRELSKADSPYRLAQLKRIPLGRFGRPDDVVGAALYLASDASAYMTGKVLTVDGGITSSVYPEIVNR
ncbi:MAG: glucose 1-dehydrogenase [Dehalococcoidales bacterium]|nr:glucose 1-dehydrogenase [Dehalococcoidales bacterium]